MRLLFSGGTICETPTFKRLLITAEEIGFMDRPSVTFANWGTIGHDSEARGLLRAFEGKMVSVTVHAPPSGPVRHAYLQYIRADLANPDFRAIFLRGLAESLTFAAKFVQADADYGSGKGREVIAALLADTQLAAAPLRPAREAQRLFQVDDDVARRDTLRVLLTEASTHVTNAMVVGAATGLIPVTDDPFLAQLLWLRSSSPTYVGGTAAAAPLLALELSRAVIPDEALQQLDFATIVGYREEAKLAYEAWSIEVNKLAARLDDTDPAKVRDEVPRIIATEIKPRIFEYQNEMRAIAGRLFGDVLKRFAAFNFSTLSLAYLAQLSPGEIVSTFLAATVGAAVPPVVDYAAERSNVRRKHAMAYLLGLARHAG